MSNEVKYEVGNTVSYKSKKIELTGKIVKIYEENGKTYHKILSNGKYHYKQSKDLQLCN